MVKPLELVIHSFVVDGFQVAFSLGKRLPGLENSRPEERAEL